jgi:YesN/AraC family two-component response regulator
VYKLLIADDERIEREAIRHFVIAADLPFSGIFEAAGGNETVRSVLREKPDILILDVNMPGINGLEALEKIRREGCNVKTLISTAWDTFDFAVKALRLGAVDFLVKPVKQEVLVSCLAHIIEYFKGMEELPAPVSIAADPPAKAVARLRMFIEENYSRKINLDDIIDSCSYSKYHASRIFKSETGRTLMEYLIQIRIEKAKELLLSDTLSIKEISARTGFSDPNYFTWTFHKYLQCSPGQYRDSNKLE